MGLLQKCSGLFFFYPQFSNDLFEKNGKNKYFLQSIVIFHHSCPIKSWKKEKCTVARRGGCRRARSGCANEPQGNRLADAHKEL